MNKLYILIIPLLVTGCTGMAKLATQLKNDPAAVHLKITTIYGTAELTRVGQLTNSATIAPDGTLVINGQHNSPVVVVITNSAPGNVSLIP